MRMGKRYASSKLQILGDEVTPIMRGKIKHLSSLNNKYPGKGFFEMCFFCKNKTPKKASSFLKVQNLRKHRKVLSPWQKKIKLL